MHSLSRHRSRAPAAERFRLHHALEYGVWGAMFVNAVLIPLFWMTDILPLSLYSMGAVAFFLYCLRLLKRRRVGLVVTLTFAEISVHVPLVVYVIGGDGGFQYYLLVIAPLIFVAAPQFTRIAAALAASLFLLFVGLDLLTHTTSPLLTLDSQILSSIRYANIVVAFGLASYIGWLYGRKMLRNERSLAAAANTDPLTGLSNRRFATGQIQREISRSERSGTPAVLALLDIDRFKDINDAHGHEAGDQVIVAVADALRESLRTSDLVARWGGEEFLLVLPGATEQTGAQAADRIRRTIAGAPVNICSGAVPVTVSIGVAERHSAETLSSWVNRADQALYAGKGAGRNQVSVWQPARSTEARSNIGLIPPHPVQT